MQNHDIYDAAYEGIPRWDIPRPQQTIVNLVERGRIVGPVLDLGCGSGENALYMAEQGLDVTAIDFSSHAIAKACAKSIRRKLAVDFHTLDALQLDRLPEPKAPGVRRDFRTAVDSCLFHVLTDEDRPKYVKSLNKLLPAETVFYLLCFSEHEPKTWGPRRIRADEIASCFDKDWDIHSIEPAHIEHRKLIRFRDNGESQEDAPTTTACAWLTHMTHI